MRNKEEKRSEERTSVTASIVYSPPFEIYKDIDFWGVTLNASPSGLSMYTNQSFEDSFNLKVHSKALWDNFRDAKVIWSKKISDGLYRTGFSLR